MELQCSNSTNLYGDKLNIKSDNLILVKLGQKLICLTRFEIKKIIEEFSQKPVIIQSQNPNIYKRGEEDRENKLNSNNFFYQIPYAEIWVDSTFKTMCDSKFNTIEAVRMPNQIVLMRSVPGVESGMHDYKTWYYQVKPISRSILFENKERSDHFKDQGEVDEIVIDKKQNQGENEFMENENEKEDEDEGSSTIPYNGSKIYSIKISDNKKYLATLDMNRTIIIWSLQNKKELFKYKETEDVFGICFASNKLVISTTKLTFWDFEHDRIRFYTNPGEGWYGVHTSPNIGGIDFSNGNVASSNNYKIRIWTEEDGNISTFNSNLNGEGQVKYSPDGKYILFGGDGLVSVIDAKTGVIHFRDERYLIGSVDFSPDGKYILASSFLNIYIWDFETKELKEKIIAPSNLIFNRICFFNSSSILINIYKQHLFIYDFILKTKKIVYDKKTSSLTSLNNMIAFTHPESKDKQIINVMQY